MSLAERPHTRWCIEPLQEQKIKYLSRELEVSYLAATVLYNRGYQDPLSAKRFLSPSLEYLHSPYALPDMEPAVNRLLRAKEKREKVLIHGDYDVDGVSGTALLLTGLERLGLEVHYYIPNRMTEGYGVSLKAVDAAKKIGAGIILTVDCGITAVSEAQQIAESGLDLVITDHHQPSDVLPGAVAVLDPKRSDSAYPFGELAGVGVAYKLLQALYLNLGYSPESLESDLDLVALGTIADVAPLVDENRVFARFGLERMGNTERPGIRALLSVAGLSGKDLRTSAVSFGLAPRLNASGRMADARLALKLLASTDVEEARRFALELDAHNKNRKKTEEAICEAAVLMAERQIAETNPRVLVCYHPTWHEGVIGIVASRLVEEYYRPVVMLVRKEGRLKGSARSIPGFDIHAALKAVREHLVAFGGHKAAAGLVLDMVKLDDFTRDINRYADDLPEEVFVPRINLDAELGMNELESATIGVLERFRPFGVGNPEPCFATRGLEVVGIPRVFAGRHLKFTVRKNREVFPVLAFGSSDLILSLEPGRKDALDMAYRISEDTYWGKKRLQLVARDIRLRDTTQDDDGHG